LSGISIDAAVTCKGRTFRENILFTHRGLSGPAILQVSLYRERGDTISIDLLPGTGALEIFMTKRESKIEMPNLLSGLFPKRFARAWCDLFFHSKPMNQYSLKELKDIASRLHSWEIRPAGTEGFHKAEVTCGGVDTDELSSRTMEAKKVPGLFFVGEVLDVTGQLGGYNLHWAWASGFTAGQYA
jgi:predicted Rossmann fold flavoprotein